MPRYAEGTPIRRIRKHKHSVSICIPDHLLQRLHWQPGDPLLLTLDNNRLIIRRLPTNQQPHTPNHQA